MPLQGPRNSFKTSRNSDAVQLSPSAVCGQTSKFISMPRVRSWLMATSRSEIDSSVIPAIPPIADAGEASVRFLGLRRLDPQLRAITRGVPSVRG